jgi:hypothetical protein
MKALRVNKKLWMDVSIEELNESPSICQPVVTPYGVCGCGCCCLYLCTILIC